MIFEPIYMVYLTGASGTVAMLSLSKIVEKVPYISRWLIYVGRNSLVIMLTHEYLQIRSFIQESVSRNLENYSMVIAITFIAVILVEMGLYTTYNIVRNIKTRR